MPGKKKPATAGGQPKRRITRVIYIRPFPTKASTRRLARRGGVKRLGGGVYDDMQKKIRGFVEETTRLAVTYMDHARRKTVRADDVVHALKRSGHVLYGY